jgi:hypothetical protein
MPSDPSAPPDLNLAVNCPSCGFPLDYLTTLEYKPVFTGGLRTGWEDAHIYRCYKHGRFWMSNSEGLKAEPM